jgi:leucyl aminopeptidase
MGLEVPAFFSNKKGLASRLQELSWTIEDPLWQLPLYQGYRKHLKSNLADMRNTGAGGRCVFFSFRIVSHVAKKGGGR